MFDQIIAIISVIKDWSIGKEITGTACYQILEKSGYCYTPIVREAQELHACPAEPFHNKVSQTAFIKHESTLFNPYTVPMLTSGACTTDKSLP